MLIYVELYCSMLLFDNLRWFQQLTENLEELYTVYKPEQLQELSQKPPFRACWHPWEVSYSKHWIEHIVHSSRNHKNLELYEI